MVKDINKNAKDVPINKYPSLPVPGPSNKPESVQDTGVNRTDQNEEQEESCRRRYCRYLYDRDKKEFCGRTCKSWFCIILYSIMYLIFLSTYTLIFLYGSLTIIKMQDDYQMIEKTELLTYSEQGIGLSATPSSLHNMPVISYRNDPKDYQKYVNGLETLINKRRKREISNHTDLGPCGVSPFGYGDNPCIIIRINKQLKWSAKPFNANSSKNVPIKVQNWLKLEKQKLWLHCDGYHSYDKEHIGNIKYYPDPPGFDPELFPLDKNSDSPLVALQVSGFTLGMSLAIQCKLWYEQHVSTIEFMLYVTPKRK